MPEPKLRVVSSDLPDPPYPPETRAKGWRFELDYERVEQSDTWALARAPGLQPWLLMLWFEAWTNYPIGTLSVDDDVTAAAIGMPLPMFQTHRDLLMRGWYRCSDDRLYHPTITERVSEMIGRRDKDNQRKLAWRQHALNLKARDGHRCVYCGSEHQLVIDYGVPMSLGGDGAPDNLFTACRTCNSVKYNRTVEEAGLTFLNKQAETLYRASVARHAVSRRVTRDNVVTRLGTDTPEPEPEPTIKSTPLSAKADGEQFAAFWKAWPPRKRKVAKAACAKVWTQRGLDAVGEQIVSHVTAMTQTEQWIKFDPAPLTYLNQRRWEDGAPDGDRPKAFPI